MYSSVFFPFIWSPPGTALLIAIEKMGEAGLGLGVLGKLGNSRALVAQRAIKQSSLLI